MSDRDRNSRDRGRAPKREHSPDNRPSQRIRQDSNISRDSRGNRDGNRDDNRSNRDDNRGNRDNRDFNRDQRDNRDFRGGESRGGYNNNNNRNQYGDRNNGNYSNNRYQERDQSRNSNGDRGGYGRGGYHNNGNRDQNYRGNGAYGGGATAPSTSNGANILQNDTDKELEIQLQTNFFEVSSHGDWVLYQYHIVFDPDVKSKALRCGLLSQHYKSVFNDSKAFDGGSTVFSMTKLQEDTVNVQSQSKKDGTVFNIKITFIKEIHPGDDITIQIFNIIFRRCLKRCNLKEFGKERAYFDFSNPQILNNWGIEIASGYKTSIEIYHGKLLLCSEVAFRLINQKTVLNKIEEIFERSSRDSYREDVQKELIGMSVITNYNKKTYRIDDIAWDSKPTDTFQTKKGEITFVDYYRQQYQIQIRNLDQPLLVSRPKEKDRNRGENENILLIPELCAVTGQVLIDPRNFRMKQDIEQYTKLNPQNRFNKLIRFLETLKQSREAQEDFRNWKMDLNSDLVTLTGRVLKQINIHFGNDVTVSKTANGWDDALKRATHIRTNNLSNWCIFYGQNIRGKAELVERELITVARSMGFEVSQPDFRELPHTRDARLFVHELTNYITSRTNKPQMIFCILPSNDKPLYSVIKQTLCLEYGLPSQCVTQNIIDQTKMGKTKSVITKVAVQMSAKLGGEIWSVKIPVKKAMIIGIDMYRDSSNRREAALAFVASMNGDDQYLTRYYSRIVMQNQDSQYANNLQMLMEDTLKNYSRKNSYLPDRIFIYRDGCSDAQLRNILEFEINGQIKPAFQAFENYAPKLTVVVVQKRGSTRFFHRNDGHITNPPMGTVVDNTVTGRKVNRLRLKKRDSTDGHEITPRLERFNHDSQEEMKDFFLVSQSVRNGTVTPSHFRILLNENENITDERLQQLTYMINHCYFNWPGQIRVPAPCHYAHKLAHLVGESLHRSHSPDLDNLLFYL